MWGDGEGRGLDVGSGESVALLCHLGGWCGVGQGAWNLAHVHLALALVGLWCVVCGVGAGFGLCLWWGWGWLWLVCGVWGGWMGSM